ncbi:MAG: EAL domain-containing protein [Sulfuricurvum sp.]|uniref:EAL domain-containing protein n=1 Tax=Sulfuricurvum sp. TaxID=2025608 RepID=UPI002721E944|nr:EAL domain-containing protein [Sulfuricurvum sp.]MDO9056894.1 EAL domain-containing protein [Sulfuricurvum sp.]
MKIKNYTVTSTIYRNKKTIVYQAISPHGDIVAIKTVLDTADQHASNKLYREFAIAKNLNNLYTSQYIELIEAEKIYLVKSYEPGRILSELIPPEGMEIDLFIHYALSIAKALKYIHENNILHLDLNPANIICNETQQTIKLLDFGESISNITLSKTPKKNIQITGGAAYSAPEQTGLSNQSIDERSDLYSLGVIFYEMLCGTIPFEGENPIQMAHSHLAQIAKNLHEIKPTIPVVLSNIVHKLLSKEKQERYQHAFSLKYDLNHFLREPSHEFSLGSQDISDKLMIPQKLYGRKTALESVSDKILSVIDDKPKLMMISGYSGIGKSSFINELSPVILEKNGYFVKGKFDQYNRTTSYVAFIQIFMSLMNTFNTLSSDSKQKSISQLADFLGESKNVLIKIIPELKIVFHLDFNPVVEQYQLKNQLFIAIERFFGFFASKEHPLVIFLDDMQWADLASLEILELIYSSNKLKNFLIIGAYRSNEVSSNHPMKLSLDTIADKIGIIEEIELLPLDTDAVNQLLRDMLKSDEVENLGELLIHKTEGNPFFLKQFIYTLLKRDLLRFNKNTLSWEWEIEQIRHEDLTNNVIDHLVAKINTMSSEAQTFIKTASVIGDTCDMDAISSLNQFDMVHLDHIISEVFNEGLIEVYTEDDVIGTHSLQYCHFVHDKIRQAAYLMLSSEEKQQTHLKVFKTFLTQNDQTTKSIMTTAKHIIEVIDLIDKDDYGFVLDVLHNASHLAKEALAYEEAIKYAQAALSILSEECWSTSYAITFSIYLNLADALSQARKYNEATLLFEQLLSNTLLRDIDIAKLYNLRLTLHFAQGLLSEAIEDGCLALRVLNQEIPNDPAQLLVLKANEIDWLSANIKSIEALEFLDAMQDETIELCMNILVNMGIPAFVSRQDMFGVVTLRMVRLSFLYGNCDVSPYGYMLCGMIMGAGLRHYEDGYRYGHVAMALQEKFNNKSIECKLLRVYGAYVASWVQPHEETLGILQKAYLSGIENGDFSYSAYCVNHIFTREFLSSMSLDVLEQKAISYIDFISDSKEPSILDVQYLFINIVRCLRGNTFALDSLSSDEFDENVAVEHFKRINFKTLLAYYYIYKLQICYLHEYYDEAIEYAITAQDYLENIKGNILESEWVFYYALSVFKRLSSDSTQEHSSEQLHDFEERFKIWAGLCPQNFEAKYLIIRGINAYTLDNFDEAFDCFEKALILQDTLSPTLLKAVTLELMGTCWKSRNNWRIAKMYLQEAYTIYYNLKAIAKAKLLFNTQSELLQYESKLSVSITPSPQSTADLNIFDEETILKATQLISGKVNRSELIEKFTYIIAQSFGIQIGGLILKENDAFYLEGLFDINSNPKTVIDHQPLEVSNKIPKSIVNYVLTSDKAVIIDDALNDARFAMDPIVIERKIISVICAPIVLKEQLIGLVYMENNLIKGFFDNTREKVLNILLTQTAVTLELENLYSHDKLTGCFSRQKLDEVLIKNDFSALLLININNLDSVNSTYGYAIGDEILKMFVKFLQNLLEENYSLYRLSSDEFVVIIPKKSPFDKEVVAANIIKSLQESQFTIEEFLILLSCTIGITVNNDESSVESPLVRAHAAMKEARQGGTNKFLTYSTDSLFIKNQKNNIEWMIKIKDAIANNAIVPFFQPIINNETNQIVKYECLARLVENGTIIAPIHFIEPARLAGLLPRITEIILESSFQYFQDKPYGFTVNISEEDLKEKHLLLLLEALSKKYNIAPNRVTLEILENISAYESEAALEQLLELKNNGFKIALDDFGSEKSNFLRLQKLNVDYIKIDGSFIKDIHENKNNLNICKTIVHLAQALNCEVIAEFVHSSDVFDVVKEIGIKYSQGYYFGAPKDTIIQS